MLPPVHKKAKVPDVVTGVPLKDKPSPSILAATDVTVPDVLELPAPIRLLTSAPVIPLFKVGVVPLLNIAGTPVSVTFPLLVVMFAACVVDIVVVSPAIALVAVVPIINEDVPAPMSVLISPADIFVLSDGAEPLDKTAGVPVSDTLAVLAVIALACADVIPVFALLVVMFDA